MNARKFFLNFFIFAILIVGFLYLYINTDRSVSAKALGFCVKNDFTNYITIDVNDSATSTTNQCPAGYFLAPAGFNLNLIQYPTSQDITGTYIVPNATGTPTTTPDTNQNYNNQTIPGSTYNPYANPNAAYGVATNTNTNQYGTNTNYVNPNYNGPFYDKNGNLITDPNYTGALYDANGNLVRGALYNNQFYDANGNPITSANYTGALYDANGNLIRGAVTNNAQLYEADGQPATDPSYIGALYDANGNMVRGLTSSGPFYDANKNLITDSNYSGALYDANGKMVRRATHTNTQTSSGGIFDANGNPITSGTYAGPVYDSKGNLISAGSQNGNNGNSGNSTPSQSIESGKFEDLDPTDYKYCVLLTRDLSVGDTDAKNGREVSALQMYLYDRGFANMPASGTFDKNTFIAVERFQYRNQIPVTGVVTSDFRDVLKEITCIKYPQITYVEKPISPSPITVKVFTSNNTSTKTTTPKVTNTNTNTKTNTNSGTKNTSTGTTPDSSKTVTIIPSTDSTDNNTNNTATFSPVSGDMYLSKGNNLYFTYNKKVTRPYICISLNNTDCTDSTNYAPVTEGVMASLFDAVNLSGYWVFSLYNGQAWGAPGDKTRIYLKDTQNASTYSIYTVNVFN